MKRRLLILVFLLAPLVRVPGAAWQDGGGHFSKDGLSFDYPAAWRLDEDGDAKMQRVTLTPAGASNIILLFAEREPIKSVAQLFDSRTSVTMPYVTNIAHKLGLNGPPPNDAKCVQVGGRPAGGFRMNGVLEGKPTTAEIYTVVLGQRLLHLVHVRADVDEAKGAAAWKSLLDTLKVEAPAQPLPEAEEVARIVTFGVINGKVKKRPMPSYPIGAKASHAQGTVAVRVVVDEKGDVISASAVSGHPQLQHAAVESAREAKFEPTMICGKPVKVSGVITYNFIRQ